MGLLDSITGGGLGMLPGADMISLVAKGVEVLKGLFDKGDTKNAEAVLQFLNKALEGAASQGTPQAAEQQPFTPPQSQVTSAHIQITVSAPSSSEPDTHATLPTVDGSAQGDRNLSDQARPFVEGSDANKNRALTPGSNEWLTAMWAMQQNGNVRYNADTQRFFMQMKDGSKRDLCSLADAQSVIQNGGGYDRNNPVAAGKLGDFLKDKVSDAQNAPVSTTLTIDLSEAVRSTSQSGVTPDQLNAEIEKLRNKLLDYQHMLELMAPLQSK
jgi:hypothetical protein